MKNVELINRNKRGITLISLIVTIIIMLILVGGALNLSFGENGIIKRAIDAKNITEDAQVKEIVSLAYSQAYIKGFQDENNIVNLMQTELEKDYGVGNVEVSNNNGTYIVEISEKGIYYIDSNGTVGNTSRPEIVYEITQTNGNELVDGVTYTEALIKINVSNKADLDEITAIELYNEGENIDSLTLNLIDGEATFKVTSNRTYQAKIATNKVTSTKSIEVKNVITAQVFNRYYTEGKIDVVWLDTSNNVISAPNAPVLTKKEGNTTYGLTAVEYDPTQDDYWKDADTSKEWYRYVAQPRRVGDTETGTSKWANARAKDGSLFVWIPRYAYKITYYDTNGNEIGYSTNVGIIDADGNIIDATDENYAKNEKVKTAGYTDYIVHPAFTTDAPNGGGWDEELAGLWFGKFETRNNSGYAQVVAAQKSWRGLRINQMYNYGLTSTYGGSNNSNNVLQSHMIKNSEWGAVAYLTYSQYGLRGGKIIESESVDNYTSYTGGSEDISKVYSYNVYTNTTHNQYGIYDMYGGSNEFIASYVNNKNESLKTNGNYNSNTLTYCLYGFSDDEQSTSTKFKTVYLSTVADGSNSRVADYQKNSTLRGDAVYEISNSSQGSCAWFDCGFSFPYNDAVFFNRNSYLSCGATNSSFGVSFSSYRLCLCL